jgi:hypothetical protein
MNTRGWGWTPTEIRQAQLVEWIGQQPADQRVPVTEFYDSLPDQSMSSWDVAFADLKLLERKSQIKLIAVLGGIPGLQVYQFQGARAAAEDLRAKRADVRRRRQACRDAIVDWLASVDAVSSLKVQVLSNMLDNPRFSMWFGEPFTVDDIAAAAEWLHENGLTVCADVAGTVAPMFAYLSEDGIKCVDRFDSHADQYIDERDEAQRGVSVQSAPHAGPTFNFGAISGGTLQVAAGDHAHQVAQQANGASTDDLQKLITGIAELVSQLVPAADIRDAQASALASARTGAVDRSAIKRFADWAISTVRAGATAAVVPAVTAATSELMQEAARVAGHLG